MECVISFGPTDEPTNLVGQASSDNIFLLQPN
jgi:hypothetical protein